MSTKKNLGLIIAGFSAGAINGVFGAGGGMILVPMLTMLAQIDDEDIFSTSVAIIFPICITSLIVSPGLNNLPLGSAWPYMLAAIPGGLLAGRFNKKIPVKWLHRGLGVLILAGGIRYLC